MRALYTFAVRVYTFFVHVAALFGNAKAKLWVQGRRTKLPADDPSGRWVWFHAASLGEFEQGRPLIEAIKDRFPDIKVSLSFFSPSGYEVRKDYPLADEVCYLPADTLRNAREWVARHHFVAAFFIKYEFWYNYMKALDERSIPLYYVSLLLRPGQYFFKPYGTWFKRQLGLVNHFFAQDETTVKLLHGIGYDNVTLCGDTRFDRVAAIARQARSFPEIEAFLGGRNCIIAGSTWPPDEKLLANHLAQLPDDYCMIVAPHDISDKHLQQIGTLFKGCQTYTELDPSKRSNVLVINTIGILSQLYQYARFVYIGGGFGVNIHNIQEPVTFGCPVVFGPKYEHFKEAVDLVERGGAFCVKNQEELNRIFVRLAGDEDFCRNASQVCKDYLDSQLGATDAIMRHLTSTFSV